jgi:hypothetical protein
MPILPVYAIVGETARGYVSRDNHPLAATAEKPSRLSRYSCEPNLGGVLPFRLPDTRWRPRRSEK